MSYFNSEFISFFKGLAANNNKEYFDANRKIYTKQVKEPFQALVMDVRDELGKTDASFKELELKNALFRINRDIRFSKDKTPYNLHVSAVVSPKGRKDMQDLGLYMHLNIDKCFFGGGMYQPDKENLEKIRHSILDNPKAFRNALNEKNFQSVYGGLAQSEVNKILPKEMKQLGTEVSEIYNKQFYFMAEHDGQKTILRDDLLPFIVSHYTASKSFNSWLKSATLHP